MSSRTEADIDQLYLKSLGRCAESGHFSAETRLNELKNPKSEKAPRGFVSDLAKAKDLQLFSLLTADQATHVDEGKPLQPLWIQRAVAPQTCALNSTEKLRLLKHEQLSSKSVDLQEIGETCFNVRFTLLGAVLQREVVAEKRNIDSEEVFEAEQVQRTEP